MTDKPKAEREAPAPQPTRDERYYRDILTRIFVPRKTLTFETLLAENARLSRQLAQNERELETLKLYTVQIGSNLSEVSRQLEELKAEPDWHAFYTESQTKYLHEQEVNDILARQLEEAREALWDVLKRIAAIGECGVQCPKCVKELHIMKSEAERVLADKEGTKP
jgi:hypothetical protein